MILHRQDLVLPLLRCPQCGESNFLLENQLECNCCDASYRVIEGRPVFHQDNFYIGLTLSWIIHNILEAAERHLPLETIKKIEGTSLEYWKAIWKEKKDRQAVDSLGLLNELMKLPQYEQAKISLGFELIAKTPISADKNTVLK